MNSYSYPVHKPAIYAPNPTSNLSTQPTMHYYVPAPVHQYHTYPHHQQQVYATTTTHRASPRSRDYLNVPGYTHSSPATYPTTSHLSSGHHHQRSHSLGPSNATYLSPATHRRDTRRSPGHVSSSGHSHSNHGHTTRQRRASSASRPQPPVVADTRGRSHRSQSRTRAGTYVSDLFTLFYSNGIPK